MAELVERSDDGLCTSALVTVSNSNSRHSCPIPRTCSAARCLLRLATTAAGSSGPVDTSGGCRRGMRLTVAITVRSASAASLSSILAITFWSLVAAVCRVDLQEGRGVGGVKVRRVGGWVSNFTSKMTSMMKESCKHQHSAGRLAPDALHH